MTAAVLRALDDENSRSGQMAIVAGLFVFAYFLVIGDAGLRDPPLALRVLNGLAAGTLILVYLMAAPTRADRVDKAVVVSLLLFAASGVLAMFPRQAFDGVLNALVYAAAFFIARSLLRPESGRRRFIYCLVVMSAVITLLTAANWITTFVEWWSLTSWTVFPPLNMNFFGGPWGHRHNLTLLIVMLYPAWFLIPRTPLRNAMATVVGILVGLILVIDGSRTLWFAVVVASTVFAAIAGRRLWPQGRQRTIAVVTAGLVALAALVVSGTLTLLVERAIASESVDLRVVMWQALADAWTANPAAGYGPGSFPWILQLTDYFDTNALAPRHPDNAILQLLGEGGLLGLIGLGVLLVVLTPALYRGRSRAAVWALLLFAAASLGTNPTDFGYLVALAIAWAAFAVPHVAAAPGPASRARFSWVQWASVAAMVAVAAAWTSMAAGDLAYGSARAAIDRKDWKDAAAHLESAMALDPGMGIYARQLGSVELLDGDPELAIAPAERSTEQTPPDDLSWRVLALGLHESGMETARSALDGALETQRSDVTNLLLLAHLLRAQEDSGARAVLVEIAQAWPEVVSAPGWSELLPDGITTADVVEAALGRWMTGEPSPEPLTDQPVLLAVMAGQLDLAQTLGRELLGPTMGPATVAVLACHSDARDLLASASNQDRRSALYWMLVERQSSLEGDADPRAARILQILTGIQQASTWVEHQLNPLDENGRGYTADTWGYRRPPIQWPDYALLPDPEAGAARLRVEPRDAVRSAGLEAAMPECAESGA